MAAKSQTMDGAPKGRKKSKAETSQPRRRASDRERDALRNEVLGIIILTTSLCLLLSLVSFYPEDMDPSGTAALTGKTKNLIGPVGASLADIMLAFLGLSAFVVPVILATPGLCFVLGKPVEIRTCDAIGHPVLLGFCAMAAHLLLDGQMVVGHAPGGWVGAHGAEILRALFGMTGAFIVVYATLALTFVLTTRISLVDFTRDNLVPALGSLGRRCQTLFARGTSAMGSGLGRMARPITKVFGRKGSRDVEDSDGGDSIEAPVVSRARITTPGKRETIENNAEERECGDRPSFLSRLRGKKKARNATLESGAFAKTKASLNDQHADEAGDTPDAISAIDSRSPSDRAGGEDTCAFEDSSGEPRREEHNALPKTMSKPVVNRRRSKEVPAEQIEIPLPENDQFSTYHLPPLHMLDYDDSHQIEIDPAFLQEQAKRLMEALQTFKIEGRVTEIHPGPVVTMYEFEPAPGVRISKISGLADDLAMALKAVKVRIVAPIPGKGVVGFEVPNAEREMVFLKEIIGSKAFQQKKLNLPIVLGKDIHGEAKVADLSRMPHLLVAGTTGSGKSVGVNGMITSLLYRATPEEVRFIMVDPKMLELSIYEGIPHLLLPVVTDPKKASLALKWAVDEMERRYELMKDAGVRDLRGYNRKVEKLKAEHDAQILRNQADALEAGLNDEENSGESEMAPWEETPVESSTPPAQPEQKLPYIVVVIDEFADLMMVAGKEVEYCVARIAQKARAAGIHLILATQRPSTDVITGVIKANFPTRIAFQVSSSIDSRTILNTNGAENLLGKGDMLFMPPGTSRLMRVHGAFVTEEEIHQIVEFIGEQQQPQYLDPKVLSSEQDDVDGDEDPSDMDPMYEEAIRVVARDGRASTSHLQRRLSLGYNRAARIVDQMERDGLVGPSRGAKPREVDKAMLQELIGRWDAA